MDARFPEVVVPLAGADGNALAILGAVRRALSKAGVDAQTVNEFCDEATSGDYDNLLAVVFRWVTVE